ncbi:adaptin ear-binding coat-associated protein 2 isoform X3 [Panthera uncia]|uniref:adaptin ear-binding coat-associated protein 2 isoform X3 n=1 Tax=Panthera uncia TaxID=29064 RepID=UPI0020FF8B46|nr:adaptin ear-binding coat-associated protein 2 isoform X3 [Panthera uncia]
MEEGEYESVLCVKPEVHVYRIPPRATNRGYRAAEWQLDQPSWSGRLRITAKGQVAYIKLEDRTSGELFAQAPVDQFPGTAVESVTDSSRYFVIRIEDGNGRRAFIGIGFGDRGDAFDFNVALQDHFKWVKQQCEFAKQAQNPDLGPKLDLGFKEGQTIKLNIATRKLRLSEIKELAQVIELEITGTAGLSARAVRLLTSGLWFSHWIKLLLPLEGGHCVFIPVTSTGFWLTLGLRFGGFFRVLLKYDMRTEKHTRYKCRRR